METPYRKDCIQGLEHVGIKTYSLLKNGLLSTNIKLSLYKALIRSVMTYACPIWEHVVEALFLKLQRLQNRVPALLETLTLAHGPLIARGFQNFLRI
jgi:hypothetical protein